MNGSASADATTFAAYVLPIIESLRAGCVKDLRGLAAALNNRGVRTRAEGDGMFRTSRT